MAVAGLMVAGEGRAEGIAGERCQGALLVGESLFGGGVMGGKTQLSSPEQLRFENLNGGRRRESIASVEGGADGDVVRRRRGVGRESRLMLDGPAWTGLGVIWGGWGVRGRG